MQMKYIIQELKEDFINYNDKDVLVIAPTSYGKSELVLSLIKDFDKIAIIVPTKALIYKYESKILKFLNDKEVYILTGIDAHKNYMKKYICILTQERLKAFIYKNIEFNIAFIDEAHNLLEDDERAHKLAECILKLKLQNNNIIFKFFTPFLNEPENLTLEDETVSFENNSKSELIKIEENIKSENFYLVDFCKNEVELFYYDKYLDKKFIIQNNISENLESFIINNSKDKNLIYVNGINKQFNFIKKFRNTLEYIEDSSIKNICKNIAEFTHKDFVLIKCISKGIVFHNSYLNELLKNYIEYIYKNTKCIKYIIAFPNIIRRYKYSYR